MDPTRSIEHWDHMPNSGGRIEGVGDEARQSTVHLRLTYDSFS